VALHCAYLNRQVHATAARRVRFLAYRPVIYVRNVLTLEDRRAAATFRANVVSTPSRTSTAVGGEPQVATNAASSPAPAASGARVGTSLQRRLLQLANDTVSHQGGPRLWPIWSRRRQASHPLRRLLTGSSFCSFRLSARFPSDRLGTVTDHRARRAPGGEQAANALQLGNTSRYATMANAKVSSAIEALRLVTKWRCLCSHGRGHRSPEFR
jgi:hypothetical protein